ncbi:GATA transcription factor 16-like [Cornus florida]|uniref:GATA transcription factor 16-like n=1 Tax=Cornus florida TaxID=4283 RepID=UPI00289A2B0E|nr:GATA transcription factor 16-like [Cornus florida]
MITSSDSHVLLTGPPSKNPLELMDQTQKESIFSEETNEIKKCCGDCKTTNTPLWRVGPDGPKSLCNACGIRYRKKRTAVAGVSKGSEKSKENSTTISTNNKKKKKSSSVSNDGKDGELKEGLRVRLMALGKEVVKLQKRQRSPPMKRQTSSSCRVGKLGEEEEAAFLLMALSCASVLTW